MASGARRVAPARPRALCAVFAGSAEASPPVFQGACPTYGDEQICSASIPSYDGTLLDADLTKVESSFLSWSRETPISRAPSTIATSAFAGQLHRWANAGGVQPPLG